MRISRLAAGIAAAVLVATAAVGAVAAEQAPGFSLKTVEGKTVSLDSLKGKVVFLDFWASWCPPCRKSIPAIKELHREFDGTKKVAVLGINVEGDEEAAARSAEAQEMEYPVLVGDRKVVRDYRVSGIPAFFIIGPDGKIAKRYVGYQPGMGQDWAATIRSLLDGKTERKR